MDAVNAGPAATLGALERLAVVPVVTLDDAATAGDLGRALVRGGLPCAEVTLRTDAGLDAIERLRHEVPDLLLGAGTVLTVDDARDALAAGASFLASPGYDDEVVAWSLDAGVLLLPGVVTPTEMMRARRAGLDVVKFFPASASGGAAALRAAGAVFPDLRFVPTGGIGPDDVAEYLAVPSVVACGGSWMAPTSLLARRDWRGVEAAAADAVDAVRRLGRWGGDRER